jgi:hypothetical protein
MLWEIRHIRHPNYQQKYKKYDSQKEKRCNNVKPKNSYAEDKYR